MLLLKILYKKFTVKLLKINISSILKFFWNWWKHEGFYGTVEACVNVVLYYEGLIRWWNPSLDISNTD
jgi:hypothetical protein